MTAAGAAYGNDQLRPSLLQILGQQKCQQRLQPLQKPPCRLRCEHIFPHRLVQPRQGLQLRHIVGVGEKPHIKYQIRLQRQAILKAEGHDADIQRLPGVAAAEQGQKLAA